MEYKVAMKKGGFEKINLVWKSKAMVLGVHKEVYGSRYTITHLLTGIALNHYKTKKEAVEVAEMLLSEAPPSTWVFISEDTNFEVIRGLLNRDTKVNQKAKRYEESLIKTKLAKAREVL